MLDVPPIITWADITDQKAGAKAIGNAPAASATNPRRNQRALRPRPVDQRARRRLHEDSRDPPDGERKSDALFVPLVAGEVNREEWSDSRLNVGEKKIQPVQTTERWGGRPC